MPPHEERYQLAEKVRQACIQTAQNAYEDARMDGLCPQGAWESAISALQKMDVESVVRRFLGDQD
jgi:hypothetical protein